MEHDLIVYKLDRCLEKLDHIEKKLDTLTETVTRHDERIDVINSRFVWVNGIFGGVLAYLLKDRLL